MLAGECLDCGRGVHVTDGDDHAGVHDGREFVPAGFHLANVGHIRHRTAGVQVGQNNNLVLAAENVRAFSHEMNATENDVARIGFGGLEREFEGIATKISEFDDFIALVMVAEYDNVFAQTVFGGRDTVIQGVIGNEQVGVKVATDARLDLRRANSCRRLCADDGAASGDRNKVAHGWFISYLKRRFYLRSLKPL